MKRSSARPQDELPTLAYIGIASLMMAAGWSVLFIAWPYLVDQVSPPQRLLVERTWYGLRFAVPAGVGLLALAFVPRYRRRPVALAVALACLACAALASGIELQRVESQRGDMLMAEALKQSDKYVWYGALFAAFTSLGAGLTVRPRSQTPRRARSTLHGAARWMPMTEVARLFPETGGIVIGERYRVDRDDVACVDFDPKNPSTWGRGGRARLVTYDPAAFPAGSTHGLVFAGSGGFKTVSTVVSTCLRWTGGIVCLDPTREVADMVKAFRGQGGRAVAILDPRNPEFGFNVLDWIGTGRSTAEEDVATVVGWLTTEMPDQGGNSRFFSLSSQQLLTGVLGHIVFSPEYEDKRTLKALHEFMAQPEASFRKRLAHIHKASTNKFVRDALGPFINLTEDTFSGVFKEATNEIDWLKYDPYAALVSGSSFKAQELLTGQMDVFISVDLATLKDHPGIGRVIIGALLNTVYKAEGAVADRVLFLVDEARMLGTMSLLETVRDTMRKYGITLVLVYQSVGQLDEIWGRHARSKWFDNVDWMSFAAVGHLETAEFIAKKCGTYTVETVSRTLSSAGRSSRTRSYAARDLIMPQEVMQDMRADDQIVFVRGQRPIRCGRAIFFRRKEMKALVGVSRFQARPEAPAEP